MSRTTKWLLAFALVCAAELAWKSQIRDADRLITQIESFRQNYGRLPTGVVGSQREGGEA